VAHRVVSEIMPLEIKAGSGHSVGEYSALVAAGVLKFPDALRAVRARGRAMQKAVPVGEGAMCAILGLADDHVKKMCRLVEEQSGEKPLEPAKRSASDTGFWSRASQVRRARFSAAISSSR